MAIEASPRRGQVAALLTGLLTISLLAGACGSSTSGSPSGPTEGTTGRDNTGIVETKAEEKPTLGGKLVYGLNAETNGWNPGTNQWGAAGLEVSRAIFDTLAAYDEHSQIHPFLAEAFEHDATYTNWTIKLRAGVLLHNGKTVDADVVRRNLAFLKSSPVTGGAFLYVKSISTKDPLSVAVELTEPWATFPILLASQVGVVGDADWIESKDSVKPIGTGPFSLQTWEIGNKLIAQKNPHYWRKDKDGIAYPYLDSIEFRPLPDQAARAAALKARDVDIIHTYSWQQITDFRADSDVQTYSNPAGEIPEDFILLNTQAPPFDDVDARRALAYATDRKAIVDLLGGDPTQLAGGIFQKESPWYVDSGYPDFDLAKAKELVDKVKAKHGSFTFSSTAPPSQDRRQQILQQQWAAAGIDVKLETSEQATQIINVVTGNFQATNWLQFSAPDPSADSLWVDPTLATKPPAFSLNFSRITDPALGEAFRVARASADPTARKDAFATVQKRMSDQIPFVFLFHEQAAIVATNRVQNIVNWTLPDGTKGLDVQEGAHPLYQISLKD